jgi:hypothetical protein
MLSIIAGDSHQMVILSSTSPLRRYYSRNSQPEVVLSLSVQAFDLSSGMPYRTVNELIVGF